MDFIAFLLIVSWENVIYGLLYGTFLLFFGFLLTQSIVKERPSEAI